MNKVVTFGEIMLRLSPVGYNRFFQNDQMIASFGGAESNVAVSLANFGVDSVFVTKVPEGAIGQAAVDSLRSFGVDTSKILRGCERLGVYYLEKGASQRSSVCIYDRKHSSIQTADVGEFNWTEIFNGVHWFHFTGITPALGENVFNICLEACKEARKLGVKISCDLNFRKKLWSSTEANLAMNKLCKFVDVCIANEEDAKDVFGISAENTDVNSGILDKESYKSVAKQLMEKFSFEKVAITLRTSHSASLNDWAAMLYDGNEFLFSREYKINLVDRVGGGDSFCAGLIYSLIENRNNIESLEFAVAASALKQTIEGDFNRVTVNEVEQLISGSGSGRVQR